MSLKTIFPIEMNIDCINSYRLFRMCIVIMFGMVSMDGWRLFIMLQAFVALSETHATYSNTIPNPELFVSDCPIFAVLYMVMIVFPAITSTLVKFNAQSILGQVVKQLKVEQPQKTEEIFE